MRLPRLLKRLSEGIELTLHQDSRFKSDNEDKGSKLEQDRFVGPGLDQEAAITRARQICLGVTLARELVSAPANIVNPHDHGGSCRSDCQ